MFKRIITLKKQHKIGLRIMSSFRMTHNHTHTLKGKLFPWDRASKKEKQLQALCELLANAMEQATESILITDTEGIVQYVNPAFYNVTGFSIKEIVGKKAPILMDQLQINSKNRHILGKLLKGDIWKGRLTSTKKDDSNYVTDVVIIPIRNQSGDVANLLVVKRDITHATEQENFIRHSQKMEAIGTLAGGIAHDFNNLFFAITGNLFVAKKHLTANNPAHIPLEQASKAIDKATHLVRQILFFSHQQKDLRHPVHLSQTVSEVIKLLQPTLNHSIKIECHIDQNCDLIWADPFQMHQMIMNLCKNAGDALHLNGGTLEISLEENTLSQNLIELFGLQQKKYIKLTVKDNGSGMNEYIKERIFEPFFTTKPVGEGSGMGLAVVHGIVKSHNGVITVSSKPNHGSTFQVFIPTIQKTSHSKDDTKTAGHKKGDKKLIVDDKTFLF